MSYKTSFMDGESYGAADLNEITARLVTNGIADNFADGMPYNVRHLNNLISGIVGSGVADSNDTNLKVIYENGSYYIQPGLAFFGNGSTLEVVTKETVAQNAHGNTYIYLVSDEANNRNYIEVSAVAPNTSDENVVYLASISEGGTITDRRTYATGKVVGYQNGFNSLKKQVIKHTLPKNTSWSQAVIEQNLETHDLRFVLLINEYSIGFFSAEENYHAYTYYRSTSYHGNGRQSETLRFLDEWRTFELTIQKKENKTYKFIYTGDLEFSRTVEYTIYYI